MLTVVREKRLETHILAFFLKSFKLYLKDQEDINKNNYKLLYSNKSLPTIDHDIYLRAHICMVNFGRNNCVVPFLGDGR